MSPSIVAVLIMMIVTLQEPFRTQLVPFMMTTMIFTFQDLLPLQALPLQMIVTFPALSGTQPVLYTTLFTMITPHHLPMMTGLQVRLPGMIGLQAQAGMTGLPLHLGMTGLQVLGGTTINRGGRK